jgi:hypothetical protein
MEVISHGQWSMSRGAWAPRAGDGVSELPRGGQQLDGEAIELRRFRIVLFANPHESEACSTCPLRS